MNDSELSTMLYQIGALRSGDFTLKDGRRCPFYLDLRLLISHPDVLSAIGTALAERASSIPYDRIAGIPYAGLPLGVAMALAAKRPLIYPRKETKSYGTGRLIEGEFRSGERILVVDDVITSGGAKLEAIVPLREAGLVVEDVLVVVDRREAGRCLLTDQGIHVHSLLSVRAFLRCLRETGAISEAQVRTAFDFHGPER